MAASSPFPFTEKQMVSIISWYSEGLGSIKIAELLGPSYRYGQVLYALRKYNVPIRSSRGRPQRSVNILPKAMEIIDGALLGDGFLYPITEAHLNSGFSFVQTVAHSDFVFWIKDRLIENGIQARTYLHKSNDTKRKDAVTLYTQHTIEFTHQRFIWYPNGKKCIPRNLNLSPTALLLWYLGDGTKHTTDAITLYTNSFGLDDCNFLQGLLFGKYGIESVIHLHKPGKNSWSKHPNESVPTIYIPTQAAMTFYGVIGECSIPSFAYKWPDQ